MRQCLSQFAGAALVGRSVLKLTRVSPGFEMTGLVAGRVSLPARYDGKRDEMAAAADRILERVRATPGFIGAEAINQVPLGGSGNSGDFRIVGRATTDSINPLIRDVSPGYFALLRLPLFQGRTFFPSDTRASQRVVAGLDTESVDQIVSGPSVLRSHHEAVDLAHPLEEGGHVGAGSLADTPQRRVHQVRRGVMHHRSLTKLGIDLQHHLIAFLQLAIRQKSLVEN